MSDSFFAEFDYFFIFEIYDIDRISVYYTEIYSKLKYTFVFVDFLQV